MKFFNNLDRAIYFLVFMNSFLQQIQQRVLGHLELLEKNASRLIYKNYFEILRKIFLVTFEA